MHFESYSSSTIHPDLGYEEDSPPADDEKFIDKKVPNDPVLPVSGRFLTEGAHQTLLARPNKGGSKYGSYSFELALPSESWRGTPSKKKRQFRI